MCPQGAGSSCCGPERARNLDLERVVPAPASAAALRGLPLDSAEPGGVPGPSLRDRQRSTEARRSCTDVGADGDVGEDDTRLADLDEPDDGQLDGARGNPLAGAVPSQRPSKPLESRNHAEGPRRVSHRRWTAGTLGLGHQGRPARWAPEFPRRAGLPRFSRATSSATPRASRARCRATRSSSRA